MVSSIPIEYETFWNRSIRPRDKIITGAIILRQDGHRSKDNKWLLPILHSSRTIPSPLYVISCQTQALLGSYPSAEDKDSIF